MRMRPVQRTLLLLLALTLVVTIAAGCPRSTPANTGPGSGAALPPLPELISHSELRPITAVTVMSQWLYAGTPHGLLRFHRKTGAHQRLTKANGLSGNRVYAVAADSTSGLWVATDGGLSRQHNGKWSLHNISPRIGQPTSAMVVSKGGVWLGGTRGLGLFTGRGWRFYLPGAQVSYMLEDLVTGGVWVGTKGEGIYQFLKGTFVSHSPAKGQPIRTVRSMSYTPDGGLMAVGQTKEGVDLLAFYDGRYWISYTPTPAGRINWVQQVDKDILLSYGNYLLSVKRAQAATRRPGHKVEELPQGPIELKGEISSEAPSGYPSPRFYTVPSGRWLPPDPTVMVGYSRQLLIGTKDVGVVLYDGVTSSWFRTNDLLGNNGRLRMACDASGCYMPGKEGQAYRFKDKGFEAIRVSADSGSRVQAFVNDLKGQVIALHTPASGNTIVVSRLLPGGKFARLYEVKGSIPSGRVELRFARVDPRGQIWAGLWYVEASGDRTPWGLAVLRPPPPTPTPAAAPASQPAGAAAPGSQPAPPKPMAKPAAPPPTKPPAKAPPAQPGAAPVMAAPGPNVLPETDLELPRLYHRSTLLPDEDRPQGSLALPDDIRDVYFDYTTTWLATGLGVCRVKGTEVTLFTENDGLASEIVYGVVRAPGGDIYVASYSGVGRYFKKKWYFSMDEPLDSSARAFAKQGLNTLWVGTFRGVVRVRDKEVRVFNESVGLVSNTVTDLHLDLRRGRLWVLTDKGLSVMKLPK